MQTARHIVVVSSQHDSPIILVLTASDILTNSDGVTPTGALNTGGV